MFVPNKSYSEQEPNTIRDDMAELCESCAAEDMLRRLTCYLSTDVLRAFMDDHAMGRV